ncbi:Hypothetical predicted protein [Lecanosticta acicola]|uniref:Uncharacterized protein n=1 Tax=Lecanosticta acicola TaxID=111012 RepID=A0AAI9E9V7_9PEZI|nr:Hypothetical predicted protein [Lecanosticta acicola]
MSSSTASYYAQPIRLPAKRRSCTLTAVIGLEQPKARLNKEHFIYEVSFATDSRYSACKAFVRVPTSLATDSIRNDWDAVASDPNPRLQLQQDSDDRAVATFRNLLACVPNPHANQSADAVLFFRAMAVDFPDRPARAILHGEMAFPPSMDDLLTDYVELATALRSTEPANDQDDEPERRTVVFTRAPQKGREAEVEVWSPDGRHDWRGACKVVDVQRDTDDYGDIKEVTIYSAVPEAAVELLLQGTLRGESKQGRFEEIGDEDPTRR